MVDMKIKWISVSLMFLAFLLLCSTSSAQTPDINSPDPSKIFTKSVVVLSADNLTPKQGKCGDESHLLGIGIWVIKIVDDQAFLCNQNTGNLSSSLPNKYQWSLDMSQIDPHEDALIELSSDEKWIAFIGKAENDATSLAVFSYEVDKDQVVKLGSLSISGSPYNLKIKWTPDLDVVVWSSEWSEWATHYVYVGKAGYPNNLTLVAQSQRFDPIYIDNPPQIHTLRTPSNNEAETDNEGNLDCVRTIYDIRSHTELKYHYGRLCITEYGRPDGLGYYRDVVSADTAILVSYNPITKKRNEFYRGEIERIFWVSDDERYAVLALDDSGKIDYIPGYEYLGLPADSGYMKMVLLDLQTSKILFQIPTTQEVVWNDWRNVDSSSFFRAGEFGKDIFLLDNFGSTITGSATTQRVQLVGDKVAARNIEGHVENVISAKRVLLLTYNPDSSTTLDLYNPMKDYLVPITYNLKDYNVVQIEYPDANQPVIYVQMKVLPSVGGEGSLSRFVIELPSE